MTDPTFAVSAFLRAADNVARPATLTLAELTEALTTYDRRDLKDGHLWSPATFDPPTRALVNVRSLCALVYDLDDTTTPPDLASGPLALVHETHTPGRYRVTVPLSHPVSPVEWATLHEATARALGLQVDPKALDASRMFYLPSHPPGPHVPYRHVHDGPLLNPDVAIVPLATAQPQDENNNIRMEMVLGAPLPRVEETPPSPPVSKTGSFDLSRARARLATVSSRAIKQAAGPLLDGTLRLEKGERNDFLHRSLSALAQLDPHLEDEGVRHLLVRVLEQSAIEPEGLDYWVNIGMAIWARRGDQGRKREAAAEVVRLALTGGAGVNTPLPPGIEIGTFWQSQFLVKLDKNGEENGLEPVGHNLQIILQNDPLFKGQIRWNEMSNDLEVGGQVLKGVGGGSVDTALANWLVTSPYKLRMPRAEVLAQILYVADLNKYNPAQEYLASLRWDGVKRIDNFFPAFAKLLSYGQPNVPISNLMMRKWMLSAVARLVNPGCQVDTSLLLYGAQGIGKSQFVRALGGRFAINTHLDVGSKDAILACHSGWLVELTEMAGLKRGNDETVRSFLSSQEDTLRLPYGRGVTRLKRHSVFVATTNDPTPLSDPDGNRRFLPIAVDHIDVALVSEMRDQLWAEAKHALEHGEKWWFEGEQARLVAAEVTLYEREPEAEAVMSDILKWMSKLNATPNAITSGDIARRALFIDSSHHGFAKIQRLVGVAMRRLGAEPTRVGQYRERAWKIGEQLRIRINAAKTEVS